MATEIVVNDGIWKFGDQDEVTSGTPATIAADAFGKADQGASVNWTNDDDATDASAVLKCQFDGTFPTSGNVQLFAHLKDVQSTNDIGVPDANNETFLVGSFPIDFGISADIDYYSVIPNFVIPQAGKAQAIDWYLKNANGEARVLGVSWQLWITPKSIGPHA